MQKILVIQTAFIGDAILTLPMIEKLSEMHPDSQIDVISTPLTEEIFSHCPYINFIWILDKRNSHKSFRGLYKFSKEINKQKYDRIYSPHRSFRTALLVMNSGVRDTFGFSNSSFPYVYKNLIQYDLKKHEVQRNFDLINYNYDEFGWKIKPVCNVSEEGIKKVRDYFISNGINHGFIAISPGSVWKTKRYPENQFQEIIELLVNDGKQVVLIGGEGDKKITSRLKDLFSHSVFDSAGLFSIIESIELLKHSSILLANDSAPTHLGMCADIKVLTLYCSTIPAFGFYPYNKLSRFLSEDDLYCKPCGIHGYKECPIKTFDCGIKLTSQKVYETIKEMI